MLANTYDKSSSGDNSQQLYVSERRAIIQRVLSNRVIYISA